MEQLQWSFHPSMKARILALGSLPEAGLPQLIAGRTSSVKP